jgi:hypothetical protein
MIKTVIVFAGVFCVLNASVVLAQESNTKNGNTTQPTQKTPNTVLSSPDKTAQDKAKKPLHDKVPEPSPNSLDAEQDLDSFFKKAQKDALENSSCEKPEEPVA